MIAHKSKTSWFGGGTSACGERDGSSRANMQLREHWRDVTCKKCLDTRYILPAVIQKKRSMKEDARKKRKDQRKKRKSSRNGFTYKAT